MLNSNRDNWWPLDNKSKLSLICVSVFIKCLWPDSFLQVVPATLSNETCILFYASNNIILTYLYIYLRYNNP